MNTNAEKIQGVINDNLFPQVSNVADVKQVLEFMEGVSQSLSQEQIRALLLLQHMGDNKRLHNVNPYKDIIKAIVGDYKRAVAPTAVYLDTIQELIPKPPRPVIFTEKDKGGKK